MSCIFCKIIAGEIPSRKIYENDDVFAFLDIQPVSRGHLLVIPKKHSANLTEVSEAELSPLFSAVRMLGRKACDVTGADGFNIIANNGSAAGQLVFHTHIHVIPRTEGDGLKHWPKMETTAVEMDELARQMVEVVH